MFVNMFKIKSNVHAGKVGHIAYNRQIGFPGLMNIISFYLRTIFNIRLVLFIRNEVFL